MSQTTFLITADCDLNRVDGATIWWSQLINTINKQGCKVIYISNYQIINQNNTRNLEYAELVNIINPVAKLNGQKLKQVIEQHHQLMPIDTIILRNNELLDQIDDQWPLLSKSIIYALDIHLRNVVKLNNQFNQLWCLNQELKQLYLKNGVSEQKIVITPIISAQYQLQLQVRTDQEIRLIYAGTIRLEEKIDLMIEAFHKLQKSQPNAKLIICYGKIHGNNRFCQKINQMIRQGRPGIEFHFNLPHKKVHELIANSDIGICCRTDQPMENMTKIQEYLAYSKPILTIFDQKHFQALLPIVEKHRKHLSPIELALDSTVGVNRERRIESRESCVGVPVPPNSEMIAIPRFDFQMLDDDHNRNKKGKIVVIYQSSLAIRSWKFGLTLYRLGYDIIYVYSQYYYDTYYGNIYTGFVKKVYQIPSQNHCDYLLFKNIIMSTDYLVFINAWENFAIKTFDNGFNPIYYIGDLQILRHQGIESGLQNRSVLNEIRILNNSSNLIFSNHYMVDKLISDYHLNCRNYHLLINSCIIDHFTIQPRDYRQKTQFRLVYMGSVTINKKIHRDALDDLIKINHRNLMIDIYPTLINIDEIRQYCQPYSHITVKQTLQPNEIFSVLSQYDYGLALYNLNYSDAEYLQIGQANKFFDYYFSNLPIICNNTASFKDFVEGHKIGFSINQISEINIKNLRKCFFHDSVNIPTYNEILTNIHNRIFDSHLLMPNRYQYLYVSKALNFFEKVMCEKFGLQHYNKDQHSHAKALFFGCYFKEDFDLMIAHKGPKKVLIAGSDARYPFLESKIHIFNKYQIPIIAPNQHIYDRLLSLNYDHRLLKLIPHTPVFINRFYDPEFIKRDSIYIYTNSKRPDVYGKSIYEQVIKKLKHKYNFILAELSTYSDIKEIYQKCFIGLRLTSFDGLGATNIELGLMGVHVVTNNLSPNCLPWKTVDDIIHHIQEQTVKIGTSDPDLAKQVLNFISQEIQILTDE